MPLHRAINCCYAARVAAEHIEETPNDEPITDSNRLSVEEMVRQMYEEWSRLRPYIDGLLNNPAARWKARRNGRQDIQ